MKIRRKRRNRRKKKRKIVMNVKVAKRRPGDKPAMRRRTVLAFSLASVVAVVAGGGYLIPRVSDLLLTSASFKVGKVEVQNHYSFSAKEILRLSDISIGQDLLGLDLDYHRRLLERHPDIESAVIERCVPNMIRLTVRERAPIARMLQKNDYIIDGNGVVLSARKRAESAALPIIQGAEVGKLYIGRVLNSEEVKVALDILKYYMRSELPRYLSITAIDMSNRENIVIVSREVDEIRLGRGDIEYKMSKLLRVLTQRHELTREAGASYLDLRWKDVSELPRGGKA